MGVNAEPIVRDALPGEYATVSELTVEVYVGEGYVPAGNPYVHELADVEHRAASA
ncbi:GNAT family N-acetyltransferase, partial [Nocardia cyriacigeorgica]|nr:GNAT family N-acetyltransferase [Nocardia cyriacigeorgica]